MWTVLNQRILRKFSCRLRTWQNTLLSSKRQKFEMTIASKQMISHETPKSYEKLKDTLQKAQKTDKIAILKSGRTYPNWMHESKHKENITIVDCSSLKVEDNIQEICDRFKDRIQNDPPVKIETFQNWGKTQTIPVISASPTTLEELKRLIKVASEEKLRVRCAGTGHSWAPIFSDRNNLLIYMNNMKSDYDGGSRMRTSNEIKNGVDIMTGVTTGDFKEFQLNEKLNIPANVILEVVQMISVVATGCHGVGKDVQTPSDYVKQMRIIGADGILRTFKSKDRNMFTAIQANFGCFGVIYDITIQLYPESIVTVDNQYKKLGNLFCNDENIKDLFEENWSVEMFWFPFNSHISTEVYDPKNDDVWVRVINKVKEGENVNLKQEDYYYWRGVYDELSQGALYLMSPLIRDCPDITPYISCTSLEFLKHMVNPTGPIHQQLPHAIHFRKYIHMAPVYDMEFAFDLKDYKQVKQIIDVVVDKVHQYEKKGEYPLNIALEMRLMGYSDALLCPGSIGNPKYQGSERVLYVEVLSVVNTDGWQKFCIEVALEWMKLDGVPHLAKQWAFIPGIEDHIYKRMQCQIDKFKVQLKESNCDPDGMFLNKTIKKLLHL